MINFNKPKLFVAVMIAAAFFFSTGLSRNAMAGEGDEFALVLNASEQRELEILKKVFVIGIKKTLNQDTLEEAQQGIDEVEIGGRTLSRQVGEGLPFGGAGEGKDVFSRLSSKLASKLGVSEGDSSNFLGQLLGVTKPELRNASEATVEDLADAMAKAAFSISAIKESQKLGGAGDGRADSMGGGGGASGRVKAKMGFGHAADDDGSGWMPTTIVTDPVQEVGNRALLAGVAMVALSPLAAGAFLALSAGINLRLAFEEVFDNPNPTSEDLNALARVERRLQWVKNLGTDGSGAPTVGTVYPKGSPGGIQPPPMSALGETSNNVEGETEVKIDDSVTDPASQNSRVPRIRQKSDEPAHESPLQ